MEMDEFDFKPITQGLGFDKKTDERKSVVKSPVETKKSLAAQVNDRINERLPSMPASFTENEAPLTMKPDILEKPVDWNVNPPKSSRAISDMINALPPSIDFDDKKTAKRTENKVYQPVGRIDYQIPNLKPEIAPLPNVEPSFGKPDKMDVSLNNTLEKAFPKEGFRRPFFHQTVEVKPQHTPVTASFTSGLLDLLVVTGLTSLFLVSLIVLTKADLVAVVMRTEAPLNVWMELGAIFLGVYLLYYMCARGLWGSTLGDWAFDMQLGLDEDRLKWHYPVQVVARMLVIALTGFVVMPLLSFIFRKDLAYYFSGLRLYARNY